MFHNVPGAEAPAEPTFPVPDKVYGGAENLARPCTTCCRCAAPRCDSCSGRPMQEAIDQLGDAGSTSASTTGRSGSAERIREFITKTRDVCKCTHDQTVRLATPATRRARSPTWSSCRVARQLLPTRAATTATCGFQRQGRVPALPGRLRRQPGQPEPIAAAGVQRYWVIGGADKAVRRRPPTTRVTSAGRPSC